MKMLKSSLPWTAAVDGDDLVLAGGMSDGLGGPGVYATCFGGAYDPEDSGDSASGIPNDGRDPALMGVALPVEFRFAKTKDSPIAFPSQIPWRTPIKIWRRSAPEAVFDGILIDNGPNVERHSTHALDLNPNIVLRMSPEADPKEVAKSWAEAGICCRIVGAAKYAPPDRIVDAPAAIELAAPGLALDAAAPAGGGADKPLWNTLEAAKIGVGALVAIGIALAGQLVASSQRRQDEARQLAESVRTLSRATLLRLSRSETLAGALARHSADPVPASLAEVERRKREYDDAYASWSADISGNLLTLRRAAGEVLYSDFQSYFQSGLDRRMFQPMDACLVGAYDDAIRGRDARPRLDACRMKSLLYQAKVCGQSLAQQAEFNVERTLRQDQSAIELDTTCNRGKPDSTPGVPG